MKSSCSRSYSPTFCVHRLPFFSNSTVSSCILKTVAPPTTPPSETILSLMKAIAWLSLYAMLLTHPLFGNLSGDRPDEVDAGSKTGPSSQDFSLSDLAVTGVSIKCTAKMNIRAKTGRAKTHHSTCLFSTVLFWLTGVSVNTQMTSSVMISLACIIIVPFGQFAYITGVRA